MTLRLVVLTFALAVQTTSVLAVSPQALATIEGDTVAVGTALPISGIAVELRPDGPSLPYVTKSDNLGHFILPAIPAGRYRLFGMGSGYLRSEVGQVQSRGSGVVLEVSAGQHLVSRLVLTPEATISGRVTNGLGEPVGLALVEVSHISYQDGKPKLTTVKSTRTNDLGDYRLASLSPGRYYVSAQGPNGPINGNLTMNSNGSDSGLSGSRSADRSVLSRGLINIARENEIFARWFFPNTLDQAKGVPIELKPGAIVQHIDIDATAVRTMRATGTVVDEQGRVIKTAQLRMSDGNSSAGVVIDPSTGVFTMGRLLPMDYVVTATSSEKSGIVRFTIRDSDIELKIHLSSGVPVSGRVTLEGSIPTAAAASLRVILQTIPAVAGMFPISSPVSADGSFVFASVPVGEYALGVSPISGTLGFSPNIPPALNTAYLKAETFGDWDVLNNGFHLDGPSDKHLEITIGANAGSLAGRGLDGNGDPVVNATAAIVPTPPFEGRIDLYRSVKSNASGLFTFDRVPAGDYMLFIWEEVAEGEWRNTEFLSRYEGQGKFVHVADGMKLQTDLRVIPVESVR